VSAEAPDVPCDRMRRTMGCSILWYPMEGMIVEKNALLCCSKAVHGIRNRDDDQPASRSTNARKRSCTPDTVKTTSITRLLGEKSLCC
jgi:hypothetical protein